MKKIFFETLKHKLGHYLLVIFCGILMVSTIYVSYAFSDSIEGIINGQNSGIVEEMYTFINFQETYILLFILMVLVIISYIQKKSYDYVLLDTMGLKKKHRYMFIGFEYAGIIFSSVTGGLILGKILAECAKTVLQNIFYNTITTEINYGFVALLSDNALSDTVRIARFDYYCTIHENIRVNAQGIRGAYSYLHRHLLLERKEEYPRPIK